MAIDPQRLRPTQLARLLNSTPLGEVISERQLHRHRTRAGFRIGDGQTVDLFRYVAWLIQIRNEPRPIADGDPYEALKERARARNAAISSAGRDIGDLPEVLNPGRKAKAATDFRDFCECYFQQTFHLPWSPDHLKVIAKIEEAVLHGGLFAMAMPRGPDLSIRRTRVPADRRRLLARLRLLDAQGRHLADLWHGPHGRACRARAGLRIGPVPHRQAPLRQ